MKKIELKAERNGYEGTAELRWIESDGYNSPHWMAFVEVPFQPLYKKFIWSHDEATARREAEEALITELEYCTYIR